MVDNKKIEEEKRYTYPEILKKYFPKANEMELAGDEPLLNREDFFDILTKITQPNQPSPKKTET